MKKYLLIFVLIFIILACGNSNRHGNKTPLVKVYDNYLYVEDIEEILPEDVNPGDSAIKVTNYIDVWVTQQLLLYSAEQYMAEEQDDIEKKIEDFRTSLLIHKYKTRFIEQKLDTIIPNEEIEEYYLIHSTEYMLTKNAIQGVFVKILKSDENADKVKKWYKSYNQNDSIKLREYCLDNSIDYNDFEGDWVYFSDVLDDIPYEIDDQETFLNRNNNIEAEDDNFYYFLKIKDYRLINEESPLIFIKDNIKTIILNKRSRLMIEDLEKTIQQNAIKKGELEYYNKE